MIAGGVPGSVFLKGSRIVELCNVNSEDRPRADDLRDCQWGREKRQCELWLSWAASYVGG